MRVRARALAAVALIAASAFAGVAVPTPAAAAGERVAIIVGPVGATSNTYRSMADGVAAAATAAGANVVKVYSPNATWANVRAAVAGAHVIVYFGHGNGFPNPYGATELTDRTNGWGLNRTTTNGDSDNWTSTLVYCGEQALLGTLTSASTAQWNFCGGSTNTDGISPAPGFVMVYAQAHYAPGFGERYQPTDPLPTLNEGQQRVRNYSYPILALGASGYFATALGDADRIVRSVLTQRTTSYADIFRAGSGYSASALRTMAHPDVAGAEVWVQATRAGSWMHFNEPDYWYAYAGNPTRTFGGSSLPFWDIGASPFIPDIVWLHERGITNGCGGGRFCPFDPVTREQMASFLARALNLPPASADYFSDDSASIHQADINRLAQAGITTGCGPGAYCPGSIVSREQMASFLARALNLAPASADYFSDDSASMHQADINRLAQAGITNGCGSGVYCPTHVVTREQMAAFLHRALGG